MIIKKFNIEKKIVTFVLSIILAFYFCFVIPQKAFAYQTSKLFSWKTDINASISTDGSINVNETKIIDITKFVEKAKAYKPSTATNSTLVPVLSPLVWNFNNFPKETEVQLSDAKIAILSNEDTVIGSWNNIPQGTYLSKWNGDDGPSTSMYTYNKESKQICLFSELTNSEQLSSKKCFETMSAYTGSTDINMWNSTKAIINLNYTIDRAATIYKDVADFQWIYVTDTWIMDSYNVDLTITVPVGSASIANPLGKVTSLDTNSENKSERNIYAWGHGSSSGIVDLNPNGTISINNKIVPGNSDAEIRIVFPSAWLTNLDLGSDISQQNQTKLTTILKEESVWRDFRTDAVNKLLLPIIFTAISILIVIACLIFCVKYKKRFYENILTQKKLEEMHPCLLVRIKNWNHEFAHDIVVSILVLNEKKYLKIKRMHSGDFSIKLKYKNWAKNPYKTQNINIIDKRTINFLFTNIACKNSMIRLSDVQNYARARSYDFMSSYLTWHSLLTDEVNEFANFESAYDKIRHFLYGMAAAIGLISIILGIFLLEIITPIVGIITGLIIAYNANTMRNKVYFKDKHGNIIDAININIGLSQYTKTVDKFRIAAINTIKQSVIEAQDIISKWNLENISQ